MANEAILNRAELGAKIHARLEGLADTLLSQWQSSAPINHFIVDDLLPERWTRDIWRAFPENSQMTLKRSLRELKYVSAQMNEHDPLLEEAIYAFQVPEVLQVVRRITGLEALEPDDHLYAGGISSMAHGHFLNPHVDNSHDKDRTRYRVLNLLFYVSPDWSEEDGCNLELWPTGPQSSPITTVSRFNRLVVMITHRGSWHSVSRNRTNRDRRCISNYYFSTLSPAHVDYFHVTSFRGRPEQRVRDWILRADIGMRTAIRKAFPLGIRKNPHVYHKAPESSQQ